MYDSIYSSTVEVAYWLKAIIGNEQQLDVKKLDQVITVTPYDYVIIGSYSKWEKPSPRIYKFVEFWKDELAKKEVCYFLTGGDWDETMVLKAPGAPVKIIAGRNYLFDIQEKYPNIKPVVIGGFGGRQVMPALQGSDGFMIWVLEKLSREGAHWVGLDIWESLVPERVEVFGNEIRTKILGLAAPRRCAEISRVLGFFAACIAYRSFKEKNHNLSYRRRRKDLGSKRQAAIHGEAKLPKIYYSRSRIKADLPTATELLEEWARKEGLTLKEQRKARI